MKLTLKFDKKEIIKSMFHRTIVFQKSKIETNRRKYKRQKFNIKQENIIW